jgi:hypothetical protein
VSPDGQNLWRYGTSIKILGKTLLAVWTVVEVDLHENGMLVATINTLDEDFVCWHKPVSITATIKFKLKHLILEKPTVTRKPECSFRCGIGVVHIR